MRRLAAFLLASGLLTAQALPKSDPIFTAMAAELDRARRLMLLGMLPYYFEFNIEDAHTFGVSAMLGATFAPQRSRLRPLRTRARVGDMSFDSANSIYSDFYNGTRYDSEFLPITQDTAVLRHELWLSADRAFKTAIDGLGRKRAMLRGVNQNEPLADFSAAPKLTLIRPVKTAAVDEPGWTSRVRAYSEIYLKYPGITGSTVDFETSTGQSYFMNTEGTVVRVNDTVALLRSRAGRQASDGSAVYDGVMLQSLDPERFPPDAEIRGALEAVAKNVEALASAPVGESYIGPVLFEGTAAAQVFAQVFGSQLGPVRRPVSDPGRPIASQPSEFESRKGSRVLPDSFSVVDEPTRQEFNGRPLIGFYEVDLEGVAAQRVQVVDKGVLRALLGTRTPAPGVSESNGHARLPGGLGQKLARFSNLLVETSQPSPEGEMKAKLIEQIRQRSKPYGLLIRKMDFPSAGSAEELRRAGRQSAQGGGRLVSSPVLAYKIFPDGREELVRGLRFRGLTARAFRDIIAAGDRPAVFNFLDNGAPLALMGAGSYVVGCSVVAPSVLFEELELQPPDEDRPRMPVVPSPLAAGS